MPPATGASLLMLADELTAAGFFESVQATRTASSTTAATTRRSTCRFPRRQQESEADGREGEDQRGDDRDAVEVALDDRGARRRGADAAAEHVGEAAALPAVQQHEEDEEQRVGDVDEADPEDEFGEHESSEHGDSPG